MDWERLPVLFVSHGAPTLTIEDIPARQFLVELGEQYRAVKAVTMHLGALEHSTSRGQFHTAERTIHDFYGFPPELYRIDTRPRAAPHLPGGWPLSSETPALPATPIPPGASTTGHGCPCGSCTPGQMSPLSSSQSSAALTRPAHLALGEAIGAVRDEGVLILCSGGAVHPLGDPTASLGPGAATEPWAMEFNDWLADAVRRGDRESLVRYRRLAPHAERAHPYPDHYMPILAALGAAGAGARGTVIHHSWDLGDLGMDAYAFR